MDFDFDKIGKKVDGIHKMALIAVPVIGVVSLALVGGIIYVAIHFLAKVW